MVNTPMIVLGVIIVVVVVAIGMGFIDLQSLNIGSAGNGGLQTSPDLQQSTGVDFDGQLQVDLNQRDALNNAQVRVEGVDFRTTFYKSNDEVSFFSIGSGTGNILTITADQNSIMYFTSVPLDPFFVAPASTADQNLNPRIIDFFFRDITNDGVKEWVFKVDLRDMPDPVAGQTASTLTININSYVDGVSTLNSPVNILNIGTATGTQNFIRWEQSVGQATADPVFEYEITINYVGFGACNLCQEKWDNGRSNIDIPNVGLVSLVDFEEQVLNSTGTLYKWKVGQSASLDNANYVTTAQNGNEVHSIPVNLATNLSTVGGNDRLDVTLKLKSLTSSQGTTSVSDTVELDVS